MLLGLHGNTQVTLLGWSFTLYVATLWIMHSPSVEGPKSQCGDSRDLWWFVTQFNHMTAASHISIVAPVMPPQKGASPSGLCVDVSVSAHSGVLELSHLCKGELSWLKSLSFQDQPTWFKIQFVSLVAGVHSLCLMQIMPSHTQNHSSPLARRFKPAPSQGCSCLCKQSIVLCHLPSICQALMECWRNFLLIQEPLGQSHPHHLSWEIQ